MAKRTAALALTHALVDFTCALLLFSRVGAAWLPAALIYNFCAFALQLPLGALCDRRHDPVRTAAAGCALTAFACFLPAAPAAVLAGVGNALFHVGGGVHVLRGSRRAGPLGVFVAPGAAGIFFGTRLGKSGGLPVWAAALACALCGAALLLASRTWDAPPRTAGPGSGGKADAPAAGNALACAACLFPVVALRAYVGLCQRFPWKDACALPLLAALVLGKALGGLLCDRLGARRTALFTLLPAAALFLLPARPLAGVSAVLLFNMTMPVTLHLLARRLPGEEGFAFGLLTLALFAGYYPVQLGLGVPLGGVWLALASLASLALLLGALREKRA